MRRVKYSAKAILDAFRRGDEGYVLYKDYSIEFFKTLDEANEVFENSTSSIECGTVKEEFMNYVKDFI